MKSDLDKITEIEDVDEAYNKFEEVMVNTIDEHAPMKKRKSISQPAPFMNKTLRSAVYKKRMTHNHFLKDKSKKNWEAYRKQRNLVAKLKKNNQLEHISMNDVLADQNLLTFMYYIYHGSYELTYLNQRIRRMSWFK
jgi:hypothetical protein